jgi:ketosteroid isomerase-like protein
MQDHRQTIEALYSSFARLNPDGMARCYADDAVFEDEVFQLHGKREVMGMWRMLCDAVKANGRDDWKLEYGKVAANGDAGQAHWDAHYRFSATGRMVHNSIDARFVFDHKGLIAQHRDSFDFWRWSRQALGTPGTLLGWTPMLRGTVRRKANANLEKYLAKDAA